MSSGGELSTEWWCVEDLVENAPTVSEWISVDERLPEDDKTVLVFGGKGIYTAKHNPKNGAVRGWWKLNGKSHYCNPTHWMHLPAKPEVNK